MNPRRIPYLLSAAAFLVAALLLVRSGSLSASRANEPPGPVLVTASPILNFRIASTQRRFGAFEFLGGLELSSEDGRFGGFSGIRLLPGRNRLIAVSDRGTWLAAAIGRDISGLPERITGAEMGPLLAGDTNVIVRKLYADCEAVEIDGDVAWLAFERNHRIARLPLRDGRPSGPVEDAGADFSRAGLSSNKGLEALARFPEGSPFAGSLLAISEESLNANGDIRAFIVTERHVAELAVRRDGEFAVTDADFLPGGDLLLLERSFSFKRGAAMRIRRVEAAAIAEGATVAGQTLMTADKDYRIDNMEGMDIGTAPSGDIHVTLISDDNFSPLQRTILLEFRLLQ